MRLQEYYFKNSFSGTNPTSKFQITQKRVKELSFFQIRVKLK